MGELFHTQGRARKACVHVRAGAEENVGASHAARVHIGAQAARYLESGVSQSATLNINESDAD